MQNLSRYRQLTGALGESTELPGPSRNRQNRCQYANDLKWPARPLQASPHNSPRAADPTPYATHTKWRDRPQRPTLPSPRLLTGPANIATRVPRELLAKIGKHWGGYMIAVRSFHGVRSRFRRPIETKLQEWLPRRDTRPKPPVRRQAPHFTLSPGCPAGQLSVPGASGSLFTLSEMILLSCITCWLKAA